MRRSKSQPPALEPFRRRPSTSSRRIAASSNHAERSLLDRDNYCCLFRRRLRRATNVRLGCFGRRRGTLGSDLLLDLRQRLNVLTQYLTGSKEERSPRTGLSPGFNPGWAPSLIASAQKRASDFAMRLTIGGLRIATLRLTLSSCLLCLRSWSRSHGMNSRS